MHPLGRVRLSRSSHLANATMTKTYDRDYFDRWYRRGGIGDAARLARKVALGRGHRRVPPGATDPQRARHRLRRRRVARAAAANCDRSWRTRLRCQRVRDRALWPPPQPAPGALRRFRVPAPVRAGRPAGLQRRAALPADPRTGARPARAWRNCAAAWPSSKRSLARTRPSATRTSSRRDRRASTASGCVRSACSRWARIAGCRRALVAARHGAGVARLKRSTKRDPRHERPPGDALCCSAAA